MRNDATLDPPASGHADAKPRLQYEAPKLKRYGDVRAITAAVGMTGTKDGGGGNTSKTQP